MRYTKMSRLLSDIASHPLYHVGFIILMAWGAGTSFSTGNDVIGIADCLLVVGFLFMYIVNVNAPGRR